MIIPPRSELQSTEIFLENPDSPIRSYGYNYRFHHTLFGYSGKPESLNSVKNRNRTVPRVPRNPGSSEALFTDFSVPSSTYSDSLGQLSVNHADLSQHILPISRFHTPKLTRFSDYSSVTVRFVGEPFFSPS